MFIQLTCYSNNPLIALKFYISKELSKEPICVTIGIMYYMIINDLSSFIIGNKHQNIIVINLMTMTQLSVKNGGLSCWDMIMYVKFTVMFCVVEVK